METQTYRVIYPLVHDHTRGDPGAVVELSDEHARPLLADGVIDGPVAPVATRGASAERPRAGKAQ